MTISARDDMRLNGDPKRQEAGRKGAAVRVRRQKAYEAWYIGCCERTGRGPTFEEKREATARFKATIT